MLSKILEKLVYRQFLQYLLSTNLLDSLQTGFRKENSTQTALLRIMHDIRRASDERKITLLVLFDFSKAFDTVSHSLLIHKLRAFHLSELVLRWFASYLEGRQQAVIDPQGSKSSWLPVTVGVSQESVLGLLLFSLFINDLPLIPEYTQHILYAGDLQIYLHCYPSTFHWILKFVARDVQTIGAWVTFNKLKLNLAKTKTNYIGSNPLIKHIDSLGLDGIRVDNESWFENSVKTLDVTLSKNLL